MVFRMAPSHFPLPVYPLFTCTRRRFQSMADMSIYRPKEYLIGTTCSASPSALLPQNISQSPTFTSNAILSKQLVMSRMMSLNLRIMMRSSLLIPHITLIDLWRSREESRRSMSVIKRWSCGLLELKPSFYLDFTTYIFPFEVGGKKELDFG